MAVENGYADHRAISGAMDELGYISRMRGEAHDAANLFRDFQVNAVESGSHELRRQLSEAQTVMARWALMAAHQEFRTVDLARVENAGDWDATRDVEDGIGDLGLHLLMDGEADGLIERDAPEARLRITVDPTIVSGNGLLAVRRKRLMIATRPKSVDFVDIRPRSYWAGKKLLQPRKVPRTADAYMEVDKVSEFVLDVEGLRHIDAHAAAEIRTLGVPHEVTGKRHGRASSAIEAAITERHPSLIPVATTYYADRKYRNIRDIDAVRSDELIDV